MKSLTRIITVSASPAIVILTFRHIITDPYLDAGTGSILIQALIGGLVGGLFALKIFWNRIKNFFKTLFSRGNTEQDARN